MSSRRGSSAGETYVATGYDGNTVEETPEQIFELIHSATGERVEWHAKADADVDAVDEAIDEAYSRALKDQQKWCDAHVESAEKRGYDAGYKQGREDALLDVTTFVEKQAAP
jgi:hypothetical protein